MTIMMMMAATAATASVVCACGVRPAGVTVLTDVALLKFMYYGWLIR